MSLMGLGLGLGLMLAGGCSKTPAPSDAANTPQTNPIQKIANDPALSPEQKRAAIDAAMKQKAAAPKPGSGS